MYESAAARVNELRARSGVHMYDEQYVDPKYRRPDVVAEADLTYE